MEGRGGGRAGGAAGGTGEAGGECRILLQGPSCSCCKQVAGGMPMHTII